MFLAQDEEDGIHEVGDLGGEVHPREVDEDVLFQICRVAINSLALPRIVSPLGRPEREKRADEIHSGEEAVVDEHVGAQFEGFAVLHEGRAPDADEEQIDERDARHSPRPAIEERQDGDARVAVLGPDAVQHVVEQIHVDRRRADTKSVDELQTLRVYEAVITGRARERDCHSTNASRETDVSPNPRRM